MDQKKKILAVDDDPAMLQVLADKLDSAGFEVMSAKDGEEGLQMAVTLHPDLILLDLLMPKMGGLEVMEKLRRDAWGKNIPIIIITNVDPDDQTIQAIDQAKPYYYLTKGEFDLNGLVVKIREKIGS